MEHPTTSSQNALHTLKEPSPIFFCSHFRRFCYQKKAHIFLVTHGEFCSRVCRKTLFSSDQFETTRELSLGMDY